MKMAAEIAGIELRDSQSSFSDSKKKEFFEKFDSIPMPKEKDGDWRYTDISKLDFKKFLPISAKAKIFTSSPDEDLSGQGVVLTDINSAFEKYAFAREYFSKEIGAENDKLIALNCSYFNHGYFLYVPENVEVKRPVRIEINLGDRTGVMHNMVVAGRGSKIDVIEEFSNREIQEEQFNSCVARISAGEGSKINFYHTNKFTKNVYSFVSAFGFLERDSEMNWICGCFGGKLNRLKIETIFRGEGSQCSNLGIFMGKGREHIDFTTNMHHEALSTTNNVLVDGILKDESTSVYRGLIKIEKHAQKTNSYLANHILKLGDKTLANSIPSLKIDANDVKASHGATVGQIDEEHLFYLMARGLSREQAESLVVEGFFEPVIQKIPLEDIRERIREIIRE